MKALGGRGGPLGSLSFRRAWRLEAMRALLLGWTVSCCEEELGEGVVPCTPAYRGRCFVLLAEPSTGSEGGVEGGVEEMKAVVAEEPPRVPVHKSEESELGEEVSLLMIMEGLLPGV